MSSDKQPLVVRIVRRIGAGSHGGQARGLMRFWPFWERFTLWLWHVQPVPGTIHDSIHIRSMRFRGRPITLPDGTQVRSGDPVLELHLNNPIILRLMTGEAGVWGMLSAVRDDLLPLARWVQTEPRFAKVRALYGDSLISRLGPRLGFTLRERPVTLTAWMDRMFLEGLLVLYTEEGNERLMHGSTFSRFPLELWMSRNTLMHLYGGEEAAPAESPEGAIS